MTVVQRPLLDDAPTHIVATRVALAELPPALPDMAARLDAAEIDVERTLKPFLMQRTEGHGVRALLSRAAVLWHVAAWDDGDGWPMSVRRIAAIIGTDPTTVRNALADLSSAGLVHLAPTARGTTYYYRPQRSVGTTTPTPDGDGGGSVGTTPTPDGDGGGSVGTTPTPDGDGGGSVGTTPTPDGDGGGSVGTTPTPDGDGGGSVGTTPTPRYSYSGSIHSFNAVALLVERIKGVDTKSYDAIRRFKRRDLTTTKAEAKELAALSAADVALLLAIYRGYLAQRVRESVNDPKPNTFTTKGAAAYFHSWFSGNGNRLKRCTTPDGLNTPDVIDLIVRLRMPANTEPVSAKRQRAEQAIRHLGTEQREVPALHRTEEAKAQWTAIRPDIEPDTEAATKWIHPLQAAGFDDDAAMVLLAPSRYVKETVEGRYSPRLEELVGCSVSIRIGSRDRRRGMMRLVALCAGLGLAAVGAVALHQGAWWSLACFAGAFQSYTLVRGLPSLRAVTPLGRWPAAAQTLADKIAWTQEVWVQSDILPTVEFAIDISKAVPTGHVAVIEAVAPPGWLGGNATLTAPDPDVVHEFQFHRPDTALPRRGGVCASSRGLLVVTVLPTDPDDTPGAERETAYLPIVVHETGVAVRQGRVVPQTCH